MLSAHCLVNSLTASTRIRRTACRALISALLSAGGAKTYGELLEPFGLDARDSAFWQIGLGMIARLIDELEAC